MPSAEFEADADAIACIRGDAALAPWVERHGPARWVLTPPFEMLVRAIVGQQISTAAARAIHRRLVDRVGIRPDALAAVDEVVLREVGLSRRKVGYIRSLAEGAGAGLLDGLDALDDDEVVARLVTLPGIGRWTAEMQLIFGLGRPDVWPVDDGGLRQAVSALYGVDARADRAAVGDRFAGHRSSAAWYLWRTLEPVERG
jgi:DNA-3-methyladenine glycosylase II